MGGIRDLLGDQCDRGRPIEKIRIISTGSSPNILSASNDATLLHESE